MELWFFTMRPKVDRAGECPPEIAARLYERLPETLRGYAVPDQDGGTLFVGDRGTIFVGRGLVVGEGIRELDQMPIADNRGVAWRGCLYAHTQDFVRCVQQRKQPISNVAEQHRTLIPCHLTNIALRLGRALSWDPVREEFVGDEQANSRLKRVQREPYGIEGQAR